jgi:hypothetical protein
MSDLMHEPFFVTEIADKWITTIGFKLFFHRCFEEDIGFLQKFGVDMQAEISKASVSQLKGY